MEQSAIPISSIVWLIFMAHGSVNIPYIDGTMGLMCLIYGFSNRSTCLLSQKKMHAIGMRTTLKNPKNATKRNVGSWLPGIPEPKNSGGDWNPGRGRIPKYSRQIAYPKRKTTFNRIFVQRFVKHQIHIYIYIKYKCIKLYSDLF